MVRQVVLDYLQVFLELQHITQAAAEAQLLYQVLEVPVVMEVAEQVASPLEQEYLGQQILAVVVVAVGEPLVEPALVAVVDLVL